MKALKAQAEGKFDKQIVPITVDKRLSMKREKKTSYIVNKDEGPRAGTSKEALAGLRPVLKLEGSVTRKLITMSEVRVCLEGEGRQMQILNLLYRGSEWGGT
jgi:acetyl-CoA acetyltransferase